MEAFYNIKNYETYSINKLGKIKDNRTGKLLPTHFSLNNYEKVNLRNPKGSNCFLVHRLVAIQFIEPVEGKPEVDHIDRNKNNNCIDNLKWSDDFDQSQNRGDFKNNKLNLKYISYEKNNKYHCHRYRIQITRNKKKILNKSFGANSNTLEDVIKYRDDFLESIN